MGWVWSLLVGLVVGALAGVVVLAACAAARCERCQDEIDREVRRRLRAVRQGGEP